MTGEIFVQEHANEKLAYKLNSVAEKLRLNAFFTASSRFGDEDFSSWVFARDSVGVLMDIGSFLNNMAERDPSLSGAVNALAENFQLFLDTMSFCSVSAVSELSSFVLEALKNNVTLLLGYDSDHPGLSDTVRAFNILTRFDYANAPEIKCFTGFNELLDEIATVLETGAIEEKNSEKAARDRVAGGLVNDLEEYNASYEALVNEVMGEEVYRGRSVHSLVIALPKMSEIMTDLSENIIPEKTAALTALYEKIENLKAELMAAQADAETRKEELDTKESDLIDGIQRGNELRSLLQEKIDMTGALTKESAKLESDTSITLRKIEDGKEAAAANIPPELRRPYLACEKMMGLFAGVGKLTDEGKMRSFYIDRYNELYPKPAPKKGLFGREIEAPGYISAEKALLRMERNDPDRPMKEKYRDAFREMHQEVSLRMQALRSRDRDHTIEVYEDLNGKEQEAYGFLRGKKAELQEAEQEALRTRDELTAADKNLNALSSAAEEARELLNAAKDKVAGLTADSQSAETEAKNTSEELEKAEEHLAFLTENSRKVEVLRTRYVQLNAMRAALVSGIRELQRKPELKNFESTRVDRLDLRADRYLAALEDRKGNHQDGEEFIAFAYALNEVRMALPEGKHDALIALKEASVRYLEAKGSNPLPKLLQPRLRHVRLNLVNEVMNWAGENARSLDTVSGDARPSDQEVLLRNFDPDTDLSDLTKNA